MTAFSSHSEPRIDLFSALTPLQPTVELGQTSVKKRVDTLSCCHIHTQLPAPLLPSVYQRVPLVLDHYHHHRSDFWLLQTIIMLTKRTQYFVLASRYVQVSQPTYIPIRLVSHTVLYISS